jgi:hypothetical protein
MSSTAFYSAKEIEILRHRASAQQVNPDKYPNGWSKSKIDPMKVLDAFSSLKIKKGFMLRAYQYVSNGNGNGVVWAMPEDSPFPEPNECPKLKDTEIECPRPSAALDDVMEAVEGDGSEFSYVSASLFAREISEFGAFWHGCSWSSHTIIDEKSPSDEFTFEEIDNWDWSEEKPKEWRPSATKVSHNILVNFYTYTGLVPAGIVCHTDTFSLDSYCFISDHRMIAGSGGGYIY